MVDRGKAVPNIFACIGLQLYYNLNLEGVLLCVTVCV